MQRIGVYGGTFDPIHNGHLAVAAAALQELKLDHLLLMPSATPPHKASSTTTAWEHRLAMLQLGLESVAEQWAEHLSISTLEARLPAPSYTTRTLRTLLKNSDNDYFFILGEDAFLEITTWEEYIEIFSLVRVVICPRAGFDSADMESLLLLLGYTATSPRCWSHPQKKEITILQSLPPDISSSAFKRAEYGNGEGAVLPAGVADYIRCHGLYRNLQAETPQGKRAGDSL